MQVVKVGNVYKAARITGPQHNFLGLALSESEVTSVTIERLAVGDCSAGSGRLDERRVIETVQQGVTAANTEFGTKFRVARLQYVPTDTPDPAAYYVLAKQIVEQARMDASVIV